MQSWVRSSLWIGVLFVVIGTAGCLKKPDLDANCANAKSITPYVVVTDQLDVKKGDRADCRKMSFPDSGTAKLTYTMGAAFNPHNIFGNITAYDSSEAEIKQVSVTPAQRNVVLEFPVEANRTSYVWFRADSGKHGYTIRLEYSNPCSKCGPNDDCVNGSCQPKQCDPPCDDYSEICDAGQCISPCEPPCRSGRICNAASARCIRKCTKTRKSCPSGTSWSSSRCRCRKKLVSCADGCPSGTICRSGRCRKLAAVCPAACPAGQNCNASTGNVCKKKRCSPVTARATSVQRDGDYTLILVNRGSDHGIRVGSRGKMCGKSLKVLRVYSSGTRAKARVMATKEQLGNCKSASISRVCK
jgi:hypothetical protein